MTRRRISVAAFVAIGLLAAVLLVLVVAPHADSNPDGLSRVAIDKGLDSGESPHAMEDSPLAGYGVEGVGSDALSTGLAGVVGIVATFAIGAGLVWLVRRRRDAPAPPTPPTTASAG